MLILLGRTSAGKDVIQKELINLGMKSIVSYTTRPMRKDEINGITYHYISKEEFLKLDNEGFFAETTSYNVATGETWYYGSAVKDLSDDKVIILNPDGFNVLRKLSSVKPVSFYIVADDDVIKTRLQKRGDNVKEAERRLEADNNDFIGVNKNVDFSFKNNGELKPKMLAEMIYYTYKKAVSVK